MSSSGSLSCWSHREDCDGHEQDQLQMQLSNWLLSAQVDLTFYAQQLRMDSDKAVIIKVCNTASDLS